MEEENKKCLKIHGYIFSSDDESDTEHSKLAFDEQYELLKPPPVEIDLLKHKVIDIEAVIQNDNDHVEHAKLSYSCVLKNSISEGNVVQAKPCDSENNMQQGSSPAQDNGRKLSKGQKKRLRKKRLRKTHQENNMSDQKVELSDNFNNIPIFCDKMEYQGQLPLPDQAPSKEVSAEVSIPEKKRKNALKEVLVRECDFNYFYNAYEGVNFEYFMSFRETYFNTQVFNDTAENDETRDETLKENGSSLQCLDETTDLGSSIHYLPWKDFEKPFVYKMENTTSDNIVMTHHQFCLYKMCADACHQLKNLLKLASEHNYTRFNKQRNDIERARDILLKVTALHDNNSRNSVDLKILSIMKMIKKMLSKCLILQNNINPLESHTNNKNYSIMSLCAISPAIGSSKPAVETSSSQFNAESVEVIEAKSSSCTVKSDVLNQTRFSQLIIEDLTENRKYFYNIKYNKRKLYYFQNFENCYLKEGAESLIRPLNEPDVETVFKGTLGQSHIYDAPIQTNCLAIIRDTYFTTQESALMTVILYHLLKSLLLPSLFSLLKLIFVDGMDILILILLLEYFAIQFVVNY